MAISGSIFRRGVALSRFGADVLKLCQKFEPYMAIHGHTWPYMAIHGRTWPLATSGGPNSDKGSKKPCPPPPLNALMRLVSRVATLPYPKQVVLKGELKDELSIVFRTDFKNTNIRLT